MGKVKKEEMMEDEPQKLFSEGERVYCNGLNRYYEAKVLRTKIQKGEWIYEIHHCGFTKNFDSWEAASKILKYNEENKLHITDLWNSRNTESGHSAQAMPKASADAKVDKDGKCTGGLSQPVKVEVKNEVKLEVKNEVKLEAEVENGGAVKVEVKLEVEAENGNASIGSPMLSVRSCV